MKLTPEELEFLKKYERLTEYERGTVEGMIDYLTTEKRKRGWHLEKGGKHDAGTVQGID